MVELLGGGDVRPYLGGGVTCRRVGRKRQAATPEQAQRLLAALRPEDRVIWALGFYAGLRRGEILGLRWCDVDLAASADPRVGKGRVRVERAWCSHSQTFTDPKSGADHRSTPMAAELRRLLFDHRGRLDDPSRVTGDALVVTGRFPGHPASASMVGKRGKDAWKAEVLDGEPITLHGARHTFATLAIAAGVGFKQLQTSMGHSSITVTLDLYGHLLPGQADETPSASTRSSPPAPMARSGSTSSRASLRASDATRRGRIVVERGTRPTARDGAWRARFRVVKRFSR